MWFGGDAARIVGQCACTQGMVWSDREMRCESQMMGGVMGGIGMILTALFVGAIILCCCGCAAFFFLRNMFSG